MRGIGRSGGAGTVANAFATGRGAAFGLAWSVTARVEPARRDEVWSGPRHLGPDEARLALDTVHVVQDRLEDRRPVRVRVRSDIPPRRGLKSSSAVAVAVARAALDLAQARWTDREILRAVVDASLRSRTSLTGALDDAAACLWGGLVFADNDRRRILRRSALPSGLVALVRVPRRELATGSLRRESFRAAAPAVANAFRSAWTGDIPRAMSQNTAAYAPLVGVEPEFTRRAIAAGAWAAGLSGKGPAEIALVGRGDATRMRRRLGPCRLVELREGPVP